MEATEEKEEDFTDTISTTETTKAVTWKMLPSVGTWLKPTGKDDDGGVTIEEKLCQSSQCFAYLTADLEDGPTAGRFCQNGGRLY